MLRELRSSQQSMFDGIVMIHKNCLNPMHSWYAVGQALKNSSDPCFPDSS